MSVAPDHTPEPSVTLHRRPMRPEDALAMWCAASNAKAFREAGYPVHSVEVFVHATPAKELAYAQSIGEAKK